METITFVTIATLAVLLVVYRPFTSIGGREE